MPVGAAMDRVRVLRSKNAGPYALTFDIVLREQADFERIASGLKAEKVASAYRIPVEGVLGTGRIDELRAFKISIMRRVPAGHIGDSDCYGMNQEQPLARLVLELLEGDT